MGVYINGERIYNMTTGTIIIKELSQEELQNQVNLALAQAKNSGDFDGYTPQKSIDYWTNEDKNEIISEVIAALPKYTGEVEVQYE